MRQVWFSALCALVSLVVYTLTQPYADPLCNHLQLFALLHLAITHLSSTLFLSKAYLASPDQLGLIVVGLPFAVLAAAAIILLRDVSSLLHVDHMRLSRADGMPIVLRPPDAKAGYHLFCSHCWRFGQDQAVRHTIHPPLFAEIICT